MFLSQEKVPLKVTQPVREQRCCCCWCRAEEEREKKERKARSLARASGVFFSISIPLSSQSFSRLFRRLCLFPLAEKRENETLSGPASTNLPGVDRKWTNRRGHLAVYLSIASEAGKKRHLHSIVLFLAGASSGKPGAAQLWIDALVPFTPAIAIESKGR